MTEANSSGAREEAEVICDELEQLSECRGTREEEIHLASNRETLCCFEIEVREDTYPAIQPLWVAPVPLQLKRY